MKAFPFFESLDVHKIEEYYTFFESDHCWLPYDHYNWSRCHGFVECGYGYYDSVGLEHDHDTLHLGRG